MRELALIENVQREDLNPIDLALCYQALLKEYDLTQEKLTKDSQISHANHKYTAFVLMKR